MDTKNAHNTGSRRLLVIGTDGYERVVAEIAEDIGYQKIAFFDDNNLGTIETSNQLAKLREQYTEAFAGIEDNERRARWTQKLQDYGYTVPLLIHPSAYVSRTACIGNGTIVEPKVVVSANACVGNGCLLSVGSIIDHDVRIGNYSHVCAGCTVKAGSKVEHFREAEVGELTKEYDTVIMKMADSNDPFAKQYREQTGKEVSFF